MKRKPSKLTKLTSRSKNVVNSIIVGDVYDFSNGKNTIEQMLKYSTTVESGYIYDKQGNRHDVLCTSEQTDCGRIAGGGMNFQVQINYSGTILSVESYYGIMSKSTGDKIISAIREGIYLEDYLTLYLSDVNYNQRDIAKQIINNDSNLPAAITEKASQNTVQRRSPNTEEKTSVIEAIRSDKKNPRQPGMKTEKTKNRTDGER